MENYYLAALFTAFGSRSAALLAALAKFDSPAGAYMAAPELWRETGLDEKQALMRKKLRNLLPKGILITRTG